MTFMPRNVEMMPAGPNESAVSRRYAWLVFALLFAVMVVNYVDRQIVVSMLPQLRAQWSLSDTRLGAIVSIVPTIVALGVVPLSFLADRWGRVKSIFLMALIWSLATIACAFAGSYEQLLGARGVVGLGEAAYGTAGAALIASLFPARVRSTMLGAFLAAAVLGSIVGVMLGGTIAARWGWQVAFGVAGVPGLILAILFRLLVHDSETPLAASGAGRTVPARSLVQQLLRTRTVLVTSVGGGMQLLVVAATYAWLPSYLNRYYGLPSDQAGIKTAFVVLVGGLGAVLCSIIADRLSRRLVCGRLYVPAAAAITTTVLIGSAFALTSPGKLQLWLIAAGGLVMTGSIGPIVAVVIDVSHPGLRATATAVLSLIQNIVGLAGGPLVAGVLADAYGLQYAMSVVPAFSLVAAAMFAVAARTYVADSRSAAGGPGLRGFEPQVR
jgi:MFS family permease